MTRPVATTIFHGTARRFDAFDVRAGGIVGIEGVGAWLTESADEAADWAERRERPGHPGVVVSVGQSFRNPLVLSSKDDLRGMLRTDRGRADALRARLLAVGYDAVVIDTSAGNWEDDAREVVALDPSRLSVLSCEPAQDARPSHAPAP